MLLLASAVKVKGSGFRTYGLGFRVEGAGLEIRTWNWVAGVKLRV